MIHSSTLSRFFAPTALSTAVFLTACGGGGGGTGATVVTPPPPSVSGDMMALSPSRGWNYHGQNTNGQFTISLYTDPQPINGATAVGAAVVAGSVATVITSGTNFNQNLVAIGGFTSSSSGYNAVYEVSAGGSATVPGSPQLVPSTLTQGQTFNPYPGVTATVTAVGTAPGASACPTPGNGATVSYAFNGQTQVVTYVPGCGITQYTTTGGTVYTLASMGDYSFIGQLSSLRKAASITPLTTVRTLLGLEHNDFPAAHLPF